MHCLRVGRRVGLALGSSALVERERQLGNKNDKDDDDDGDDKDGPSWSMSSRSRAIVLRPRAEMGELCKCAGGDMKNWSAVCYDPAKRLRLVGRAGGFRAKINALGPASVGRVTPH